MNRVRNILLILIFVGLFSNGSAQATQLEKLLDIAEQHNPLIDADLQRVEQASADIRIAVSAMGPKVGVAIGGNWNQDSVQYPVVTPSGTPMGKVTLYPKNLYNATLSLTQILYSGGTLTANKRAKHFAFEAAVGEALRTYQRVLYTVRHAYYDLERAKAQLAVAEDSLHYSKAHLKQAQNLHEGGLVSMGDVLRAKVVLSQAELEWIRSRDSVQLSWVALQRSVGVALSEAEFLKKAERLAESRQEGDVSFYLERALRSRPELAIFSNYSKQAESLATASEGKMKPQLLLQGEASQAGDTFWPDKQDNMGLSLALQWSLYDHGEAREEAARARSIAKEFLMRLEDMRAQVRLDVTQSLLRLETASAQKKVAQSQVKQAEEDFRIAQKRYQSQVGTHLDVLDAQNALIRSKTQHVDALYGIASAQAELLFAVGEDHPKQNFLRSITEGSESSHE